MKAASVKQIKDELKHRSKEELLDYCLRLSKFKKENKELLTYLLFDAANEDSFIRDVKDEIQEQFSEINRDSYHYIKKSVRKILRQTKKHIRYSGHKTTEVELLMFFCLQLFELEPPIQNNVTLSNLFHRELNNLKKVMSSLHEDLQFDYREELKEHFDH